MVNEPTLDNPTLKQISANSYVRSPQHEGGPLQPPGEQVSVRRLAERTPEQRAEMRARQPGRRCEVSHG